MGGCGSDLLERMGPEFGKFVACEKGKEFVDQKVKEVKDKVFHSSDDLKKQTLDKIAAQESDVQNQIKKAITDIDKENPGVLDKAAGVQRKTKQDLLGGAEIKKKFDSLRTSVQSKFNQQEKHILTQIDNQSVAQKKNIEAMRPQIPVYDQLPEAQKTKIFQEGEKKFADQIKSQQDSLQKQLTSKLDLSRYTDSLKSAQNLNIDSIGKEATSLINSAKSGLTGTSLFC